MTLTLVCLSGSLTFAAETSLTQYVITIENVELRSSAGQWVSVIRPDKQVDLLSTEAAVSFFNNAGRVPEASYEDFRVGFLKPDGQRVLLSSANPLGRPLEVKKGSFIRVWFDLEVKAGPEPSLQAKKAGVTVDGRSEEMEKLEWS